MPVQKKFVSKTATEGNIPKKKSFSSVITHKLKPGLPKYSFDKSNPITENKNSNRNSAGLTAPATTGRYIIIYKPEVIGNPGSVKKSLLKSAGIRNFASTSDFSDGAIGAEILGSNTAIHFENLGMALISSEDEAVSLSQSISDANSPILAIEPEYIAYPTEGNDLSEYLRGYRDAINTFWESFHKESGSLFLPNTIEARGPIFKDTDLITWGLQATKADTSKYTGRGIKIAVLDTGFDLNHPDFHGRTIVTKSFSGLPVNDIHGHGTHCIGVACGPRNPISGVRRYGIAYEAEIYVGKVFDNGVPRPSAPTGNVIAGLEWALTQNCHIASLSLGVPINAPIKQYESPLRRALNAGLLVVAAAGNNAVRPDNSGFVEPPANSDSVMAVGAINQTLAIASFSARSSKITGEGGKVNISAPGTGIFSSFPTGSGGHAFLDGTSMATPHVAGIAALWAEAKGERGPALWSRVVQTTNPLSLSSEDVGSGLVQAPQ